MFLLGPLRLPMAGTTSRVPLNAAAATTAILFNISSLLLSKSKVAVVEYAEGAFVGSLLTGNET